MIVYGPGASVREDSREPTMEGLRQTIGCEMLEFVRTRGVRGAPDRIFACDEDGGPKGLTINHALYGAARCHLDLVGTVVEMTPEEWRNLMKGKGKGKGKEGDPE